MAPGDVLERHGGGQRLVQGNGKRASEEGKTREREGWSTNATVGSSVPWCAEHHAFVAWLVCAIIFGGGGDRVEKP